MQRLVRMFAVVGLSAWSALASLSPATAAPGPDRDTWYRTDLVRLTSEPPYRTQLDGSRYAGSNCGPAVLGMVLAAYGYDIPTTDLRQQAHTYQGTWPGRGGTALQHVAHVAEDYGVPAHGLYDDADHFHHWSVDEVAEQVGRGRWVIPLVRYGSLPGHEASGVRFGHYILIYARDGDGFTYQDPAYRPFEEGRARWISREQLDRAMTPVLEPRQAVALGA
jgi:hypothetical protein